MAIDEIDGETCDNINTVILPTITITSNGNQLDKDAKSIRENAEGMMNSVSYIDEDDDDVIILESNSPSSTILIIDDDNGHEINNVGKCKNDKISRRTLLPESCELNKPHGILEEEFDNFCTTVIPPLRQYGRTQKRNLTTPEKHKNILPLSSTPKACIQCRDICEMNIKKVCLSRHQILKEQENNGLKNLSEISEIFCSTSLTSNALKEANVTPVKDKERKILGVRVYSLSNKIVMDDRGDVIIQNEPETVQTIQKATEEEYDNADQNSDESAKIETEPEIADIPVQRKSCETSHPHLNSEYSMSYSNSSIENLQPIQSSRNKSYVEREKQLAREIEKSDIKFHLNKIFERNRLNKKETYLPPVVIKMQDTPIIISENGLITVIYKPEKVKFRRTIEIPEPVSNERSDEKRRFQRKASKRKAKSSSDRKQANQRRIQPNKEINDFQNGLLKSDQGDLRLADVQKQQLSGIRWIKKKYPPIRKVKYRGEMVYKCKDCDFVHSDSVAALRRHMIRHQPSDSIDWFHCDLCDYKAKRKGNLKVHMILHRNPNEVVWYKCEMCDKKFKHKNGLHSHEKRHIKREELELYLCDQCSYKTPFKHTLLRHKINHEPMEKKKLLLCNLCSYSTYNKYYLARHRQTHREPLYKCLLCHYEAKYKVNLESHMKRHFPQEEMLYCDSCDFSTNRRYTLTLHNRNVHNFYSSQENQTFFCYNCSFQTRFKRCLVKHMSIHCGTAGSKQMLVRIKTEVMTD